MSGSANDGVLNWFGGASRVLFVHAHPDDESIWTGGAIAALNASGREATVLTLTRGERGEVMPGRLAALEGTPELANQRAHELNEALAHLGVRRHAFLGSGTARKSGMEKRVYEDSGMQWSPDGRAVPASEVSPRALTRATLAEVVGDAVAFAEDVQAQAIVSYDEFGGYGHPDHVLAHDVSRAVAQALRLPFWAVLGSEVTPQNPVALDVAAWLTQKKHAMAAHETQLIIDDNEFVLTGGQRHAVAVTESYEKLGG